MPRLSKDSILDYIERRKVYVLVVYSKPYYVSADQTSIDGIFIEPMTANYEYQRTLKHLAENNDLRAVQFRVRLYAFPPGITRMNDLVAEEQMLYLDQENWIQLD